MLLPLRLGLHIKDHGTPRFIYQMALRTRVSSLLSTSFNGIHIFRITHQRSHLTVEADLALSHFARAETQRVEETCFSKAPPMLFPGHTNAILLLKNIIAPLVCLDPFQKMQVLRF